MGALAALGVSARDEDVYRFVLRRPGGDADAVGAALGLDARDVEAVTGRLEDLELVRRTERRAVVGVDPAVAIERLIERRLGSLNEELRRVTAARQCIAAFEEEQRRGAREDAPLGIERLADLPGIRDRIEDLSFFARREVLSMQPGGPMSAAGIRAALPLDQRCLRRGVTMRTVVTEAALRDPATRAHVRELSRLGARFRSVPELEERLLVYDGEVAVVPVDPRETGRGALVVRQEGLVANMVTLFERTWASAAELVWEDEPAPAAEDLPCEAELRVLGVLAEAGKDEVGARRLNMSLRTYRRHVADLMARLGAVNRFQAALLAKERGWL